MFVKIFLKKIVLAMNFSYEVSVIKIVRCISVSRTLGNQDCFFPRSRVTPLTGFSFRRLLQLLRQERGSFSV